MNDAIALSRRAAQTGDWTRAEQLAAAELARQPNSLDALEIVILARRSCGDLAEAERLLNRAITIEPGRRWPYGDLARLLLDLGRPAEAEAVAWKAVKADAGNADALMILGTLELSRGLLIEAEGHLKAAVAIVGHHADLIVPLGRSLMLQNRLTEARGVLHGLRPTPQSLAILAEIEERSGHFAKALALIDRAEAIGQEGPADLGLLRAKVLERCGEFSQALAILEDAEGLSGAAQLHRGRLRDMQGRHAEAWQDWTEAKSHLATLNRRSYDQRRIGREAESLQRLSNRIGASTQAPQLNRGEGLPVLILGFPRSGTTLVEQILAAHRSLKAGGELPFGPELRDLAASMLGGEAALVEWLEHGQDDADQRIAAAMRRHYLDRAAGYGLIAPGSDNFTDKMPLNEFWLPLLRMAFPDAKIVRIVRHPLDVLVSAMSHDLTHGQNFAYRLEDAVEHMLLIHSQLHHYAACGQNIDHELRYEDLVSDQRGETARLMAALGLELEEQQMHFHQSERIAPTPSYAQVREPLNARSVERWRNFEGELGAAREALMPVIEALGYSA